MEFFTKIGSKSKRESSYYKQRLKNRVYSHIISFIRERAGAEKITKKEYADRLGKDPGQVSRLLAKPGNWTLETIAELLLAMDAEAEPPEIVLFKDRRKSNHMHNLVAQCIQFGTSNASTASREAKMDSISSEVLKSFKSTGPKTLASSSASA